MARILIVDDNPVQLERTADIVASLGYRAERAFSGADALRRLRTDRQYRAVLLDMLMPDLDGMALLEALAREAIDTPVIAALSSAAPERARDALRAGACDVFVHPLDEVRLGAAMAAIDTRRALLRALADERALRSGNWTLADLLGADPSMERARAMAERAAKSPLPFLIEGEPGTGKRRLARAIHMMGERAAKPFVALDCAALDPLRAEAMLFGAKRGALPGIRADLPGALAEAQGGTLYLGGVADLPPALQQRLHDALATGQSTPLGAAAPARINVRLIVGTRHRLLNLTQAGHLREDLYYRLSVMSAYLPPLRDRTGDIESTALNLLPRLAAEGGHRTRGIAPEALDLLRLYTWPGNLLQLETLMHRAVALSRDETLRAHDFPQLVAEALGRDDLVELVSATPAPRHPVHVDSPIANPRRHHAFEAMEDRFIAGDGSLHSWQRVERDLIAFALEHHQHRMSAVARALGMGRSTLYRKLREYGLGDTLAEQSQQA